MRTTLKRNIYNTSALFWSALLKLVCNFSIILVVRPIVMSIAGEDLTRQYMLAHISYSIFYAAWITHPVRKRGEAN